MPIERSIRYLGCLLPHAVQKSQILEVGKRRYWSYRHIQFSCRVELELALNLARLILQSNLDPASLLNL